jgi:hypothetical protein
VADDFERLEMTVSRPLYEALDTLATAHARSVPAEALRAMRAWVERESDDAAPADS